MTASLGGFSVEIPVPPSLNNIYENAHKGRRRTNAYTSWKKEAALTIAVGVPAKDAVRGPISVRLYLPIKTRGDCDNRLKAALDALVASGRIDDDRNVHYASVERSLPGDKAKLNVSVYAMPRAAA